MACHGDEVITVVVGPSEDMTAVDPMAHLNVAKRVDIFTKVCAKHLK